MDSLKSAMDRGDYESAADCIQRYQELEEEQACAGSRCDEESLGLRAVSALNELLAADANLGF